MPTGINSIDPKRIGKIIRTDRSAREMNQEEYSRTIGISQSFLSRLETGKRINISFSTWELLRNNIPKLGDALFDELFDGLSETYDKGVLEMGSGNYDAAEELFSTIFINNSEHADRSITELQRRAKTWVAGIRRDRNELDGKHGAVTLYKEVLIDLQKSSRAILIDEVEFMLGACREMQRQETAAVHIYTEILKRAEEKPEEELIIRLNTRLGAALTKIEKYSAAESHLDFSIRRAPYLPNSAPYSYASEKRAILRARQNRTDEALSDLMKARTEIGPTDHLRLVQSLAAEATILQKADDYPQANSILERAITRAKSQSFHHQVSRLKAIQNSIQ